MTSSATPVGASLLNVEVTSVIDGRSIIRTAAATLAVQSPGQTALAGQVRDENDNPLPRVSILKGGATLISLGITDEGGNFFIPVSLSGPQTILVDGSTAILVIQRFL
jgi:hypothetical protein